MFSFPVFLRSPRTHLIVVLVFLFIAFGYDLLTPRGYTDWAFYLLAVLLTVRVPGGQRLLIVAAAASAMTLLGFIFSTGGQPIWMSALSRGMGFTLIWITVVVAFQWRRADEKLTRVQQAVEGSGEIVFMTDPQGVITYVNPAFTAIYGFSSEEVVGKATPRILKSGRISPEEYASIWKALLEKRTVNREILNKTKDGKLVVIDGSASAILDEGGKITGFLAIQRDITERKRAEEAVRTSEASLAEAQRIAHVGSWDWDIVHDRAWWSDEMYRIFGLDPQGPMPTLERSLTIIHPDDRERVEAALHAAMKEKKPYNLDYRIVREDGTERAVHAEGEVFFDEAQNPVRMAGIVQDITERTRAEEAVSSLQKRFSVAFRSGPEPTTISTLSDGTYVDVNEAYLRVMGYTRQEVIGKSSLAVKFWAYPEQRRALLDKLPAGPIRDFEITFLTKTGERREGLLSADVIDIGGEPCLLAVTRDVTERKRAEEELKRLNRALRTIGECNQALVRATGEIDLLDTVCRILVEQGGFRLAWVGYAEQDDAKSVRPVAVAGLDEGYIASLKLTWADEERGRGPTGTAIRTGRPSIARVINKDPNFAPWREEALRRGYASCIGLPLVSEGKTLGALMAYSTEEDAFDQNEVELLQELAADVAFGVLALRNRAQRTRAEAALRESEDRYRDLIENSKDLICTHDLEGRLLSVNPEPARVLGYSREQLLTLDMRKLIAPELRGQFDEYLKRITERGEDSGLLRVRTRDGKDRIWEYNNTLRTEGLPRPIVRGIARDVTERLEAEKALRKTQEQFLQAQKMEAVGRLAGGVAHDFNNLLTVINGYANLLLEVLPKSSDESIQVEEIRKAGERAATLTRQLLAFSRKQIVVPTVLDLNAVVGGMQSLLRRLIGEDIEFVEKFARPLDRIRADVGQIEQVMMNLVINSRDAMPRGGKLIVETSMADLDQTYARDYPFVKPGQYVMLAVSDTGCGMDSEIQSHIFEPFFTTKGPGKGTGLGLSTVYGIVKQSGGHVNVYSEAGRGTTIKIYFPRIDEPLSQESVVPAESISMAGSETILLVEDEPGVRALAKEILESKGYTVLVAGEFVEALARSTQHTGTIHLLLTDVVMPGLSGKELAECLLGLRPGLKVLFISGYTADAIAQHGILDEGVAYLSKPFTPQALLRKVRQTLDLSRG